ncbi:MAG: NAD-dependent epimerase/dehydratase family protein [Bdellovibrionota bacterium]
MKALVTGASGFIGSTLIEELGTLGFDVHALMRKSSSAANLEGIKYQRIEGDLSDLESLRNAVKGMDYVFHLAGATAAPNRDAYFEHNAHGSGRIAQAVAEVNPTLSRFVYVSSIAAAGPAENENAPKTELDPPKPVSAYGESKLEGEHQVLKHKATFPITVVRAPIVYGPKDKGVFVMIQTVNRNFMPLPRGGRGEKFYSAVHVHDLVNGIVKAAMTPDLASGETFFISDDRNYTYREMMTTIADCLNRQPLQLQVPKFAIRIAAVGASVAGFVLRKSLPLNLDKLGEILPDYWICSNQKAKQVLGFQAEYNFSTGMAHAIEWYKKQKWI